MKIKTIEVQNLKAIDFQHLDLNGCSVLVQGGNRKGKSTLLRGFVDRIRGLRPSKAVKIDEKEGRGYIELTNGERFKWEFDVEGKDKLTYITKDGYSTRVTKEIANKYFPEPFDIDTFMREQPKQQLKMLADLVGLDFTDIDNEYTIAYQHRTVANAAHKAAKIKFEEIIAKPEQVSYVSMSELIAKKGEAEAEFSKQYEANKAHNENLRKEFEAMKDTKRNEVEAFNQTQRMRAANKQEAKEHLDKLVALGYEGKEVIEWIAALPMPENEREFKSEDFTEPSYITELPDKKEIEELDKKIAEAGETNERAAAYKKYMDLKDEYAKAERAAAEAEEKVQGIVSRKKEMIRTANLPTGIEFGEEGVLIDGMLLQDQNISTSQKYCAAIKLGALKIGEVEALHFDASTLDKKSLLEIESWAANYEGIEGGLQLLIERPEFDGGEISYKLIQTL